LIKTGSPVSGQLPPAEMGQEAPVKDAPRWEPLTARGGRSHRLIIFLHSGHARSRFYAARNLSVVAAFIA
jgi:hypothetical protein